MQEFIFGDQMFQCVCVLYDNPFLELFLYLFFLSVRWLLYYDLLLPAQEGIDHLLVLPSAITEDLKYEGARQFLLMSNFDDRIIDFPHAVHFVGLSLLVEEYFGQKYFQSLGNNLVMRDNQMLYDPHIESCTDSVLVFGFGCDFLINFPGLLQLDLGHSAQMKLYFLCSYLAHISQLQRVVWHGMFQSILARHMLLRGTVLGRMNRLMSVIKLLCLLLVRTDKLQSVGLCIFIYRYLRLRLIFQNIWDRCHSLLSVELLHLVRLRHCFKYLAFFIIVCSYIVLPQHKQMNPDATEFVSLYNSLQHPQYSSQANRKLIQIQRSQQSWELAKLMIANPVNSQHGCQLLSKKLAEPFTKSMDDRLKIVDFILTSTSLNKILYFCLAKIALHLSWDIIDLKGHTNALNVLGVLKQIPNAAAVVNLYPQLNQANERTRAKKIFQNYKAFLIESFQQYPEETEECLQNFVTNNFKLQSQQLVRLLLARPLSQIKNILENVIQNEKYENLHNQIFTYLVNNQNKTETSDFFVVFLAFVRSINLLTLQTEVLTGILTKIIQTLKIENTTNLQQRKNMYFIGDSFDFWHELSSKLTEARGRGENSPQIQICYSAFVQLWKIVVERCVESQMPTFKKVTESQQNVIINLDSDEDQDLEQLAELNIQVERKFRQTGSDYLYMIFLTISKSEQHKNLCLSSVFQLTKSTNPLNLQLAVFAMSCIVEIAGQNSMKQITAVLRSITMNQNCKNPYIWQQLVRLLGKLGHQAVCQDEIFETSLLVLKESLLIEELAALACENFNEILITCSNSSDKAKQTPILQQFFDYIYNTIYFQTKNEKVFHMLTKSTIIFIYNFRPDLECFANYLQALNSKIQTISKLQDKFEVIDNLALSHLYVSSELSTKFTPLLSEFLSAFLPVALAYIQKLPTKKLPSVFSQLSTLVNVGGGYNTQIWVQSFVQLSQFDNVMKQKRHLINLFIKLMQVQLYDPNNYKPAVLNLINRVEQFVILSLEQSHQDEYQLINKCLSFHFILLSKYVNDVQNYNPDRLLAFIIDNFFKGKLKFEADSTRTCLAITRNIIAKGYRAQELLEQVLKAYPKIGENSWKSVQSILYEAYKIGGRQIYKCAFKNVYPAMLPPNPLFQMLMQAIHDSNSKDFKNLLASLK